MSKQVYISADYDSTNGDKSVVDELIKWGSDSLHKVDFIDMSQVKSGSVADDNDCRICDLKAEFNRQINASSAAIFIVGDKTSSRTAGCSCDRVDTEQSQCFCTPYKQNSKGIVSCKIKQTYPMGEDDDCGNINRYSYLRHEFEQAKKKKKTIIIVYNSTRKQISWLPSYMSGYENIANPFWKCDDNGLKIGDYALIKKELSF